MTRSGLLTVLCTSLLVATGCNKEEAERTAPPSASAPAAPPSASTPTPAPSASTPTAPPSPAPASPTAPAKPADTAAGGVSGAVDATAARDLLAKTGCTACHAVDKKIVGPAYQEVAAKYRGQAGVEEKLVQKVKAGGSGVWGPVPMPPNPQVKEDDVKTMVRWILSLK